jgi:hypothetical protein
MRHPSSFRDLTIGGRRRLPGHAPARDATNSPPRARGQDSGEQALQATQRYPDSAESHAELSRVSTGKRLTCSGGLSGPAPERGVLIW